MNEKIQIIGMLLISVVLGDSAFAQSDERHECQRITPNHAQHDDLKNLFRYAQIAERPKHKGNHYMNDCPLPNGVAPVSAPESILPLSITDTLLSKIKYAFRREGLEGAIPGVTDEGDGGLSVSCNGEDGSNRLSISVRVHSYISVLQDLFDLGFSFAAEIIERDNSGSIVTRGIWAPFIDKETGEVVYSMRGTNIWDMEQILSNYVGKRCVFPATRVAVSQICHALTQEFPNKFERNVFQIEERILESLRNARGHSIVLTGHSLGGQAVQYIAEHPPHACLSYWPNRQAYAFASTRNPMANSGQGSGRATVNSQFTLESYLISGDEILERLGLGRGQIGTVTTYQPRGGLALHVR